MNSFAPATIWSIACRHLALCATLVLGVILMSTLGEWSGQVSFIWLPDGMLLAAVLLVSRRQAWAYALTGTIAIGLTAYFVFDTPPFLKAALCVVLFLQTVAADWLLRRNAAWIEGTDDSLKAWLHFALGGIVLVPLCASALSTAIIALWTGQNYPALLGPWFTSVALGIAIILPLVLRWRPGQIAATASEHKLLRTLLFVAGFAAFAALVLGQGRFIWLFVLFPTLLALVFRTGVRGLALAMPVLTAVSIWSVMHHVSPFETLAPNQPGEKYLTAQVHILLSWAACYLVAGLLHDRQQLYLKTRESAEQLRLRELKSATTALHESQERFRLLVEHAADDFFLHDVNGRFIDVNRRACESTGYTREELLKMRVTDLSTDLTPEKKQAIWDSTEPGTTATVNSTHLRKDGSSFPVEVRITCQLFEGQKYFLGMVRDISERAESERAIRQLNAELEQRVIERTARWNESARLLQGVMDGTPDLIYIKDLQGRYLLCNQAFGKIWMRSVSDIVGKMDSEMIDEKTAAFLMETDRRILARDTAESFEERLHVAGVDYVFHTTKGPYRDDHGVVIGVFGITRDITAVARAEAALRDSEARWQFALDGSGDGVWDWNVSTNRVFYSRQWKTMLGYEDHEVGNTTDAWADRIHPDDKAQCWQTIQDHFNGNAPVFTLEHRMLAKDGSWRWILDRGKVVERKPDGSPLRVIGTHTDITKRKQAEETLRESEARWQFALEGAGDGIWDWDVPADRLVPSARGLALLDYAGTDHFDYSLAAWDDRVHPEDLPQLRSAFVAHLQQQTPMYSCEYRIRTKGGQWRWFLVRGTILKRAADGGPLRVFGTMADITERKEAERALRESEMRWQFALEGAGDGVWDWEIQSNRMYFSVQWKAMLGHSDDEVGDGLAEWSDRVHPDDAPLAQAAMARHFQDERTPYLCQHRLRAKDGSWRWILTRGRIVEHDPAGKPLRMIGTHTDITESIRLAEELRLSNDALKSAERLAGIGNWSWDLENDRATWSDMLYQLFLRDPSLPVPAFEELQVFFSEKDFAIVSDATKACIEEGTPYNIDVEVIRTDGSRCFVNAKGEAVRNAAGKIKQVRGTIHDITERRAMENSLESERNLLRTLVDTLPLYVFIKDRKGIMRLVNKAAAADMGLTPAKLEGLHILDVWKGEDGQRFLADDLEIMESGNARLDYEEPILTNSRGLRWLRTSKIPLRNAAGAIIGVMGLSIDITVNRDVEEKLRTERHLLRTLIDHLPQIVFIIDDQDRLQVGNATLLAKLGLPKDANIINQKLHALLPPASGEKLWQDCVDVMQSGEARLEYVECIDVPHTGLVWQRTSKIPWRDIQGRVIGIVGISTDITGERASQQKLEEQAAQLAATNTELQSALREAERQTLRAQASERAKGEFLAIMSHEIRTPMNTVLGMVRLTLQTELTPKQHNYLDKIDLSAKALVTIINDILDFSKIEAGKLTLETTDFSIESLLESVSAVTAMKAEEKGLEIAFDVAPEVPDRIVGDSLRVGQVLINLVNNAVKFTEQGEVVVSVTTEAGSSPNSGALRFGVRDTGIGLQADQIARLFEPFTQADTSITRQYGGTGLGLAICKRLVSMMGGRIWAEGEPGRGSTFFFTIHAPVAAPEAGNAIRGNHGRDLSGRRTLIVDDNASSRDILCLMVRRFGMQVETARSGPAALDLLARAAAQNQPFELVLMDWRMPGMDGLEAARLIKANASLNFTPAVLMVTAFAREEVLRRSEQLGLQGVLIKPVTDSVMFNTIIDALDVSSPGRQSGKKILRDLGRLPGHRVLLVDDDAMNREIVTEFLQQVGIIVQTASSGHEAIARLQKENYHVMLMDVNMPEMDGMETTRRLRLNPLTARVPIIALTGNTGGDEQRACREAGMDDHLAKPIDADVLYDAILRWLPKNPDLDALAGHRVLVVDDNALNREVATDFLLAVNVRVNTAINGLDALDKLETGNYDAVLMDVQMPRMGGLEATRKIRRDPRWAALPIIALTAQARDEDREESLLAGMNAHLAKPIDENQLYQTLLRLLPKAGRPQPDVVAWPARLPGIDLPAALARFGGQQARVLRIMESFVRDFENAPATLDEQLHEGRRSEISLLAHTLKSSAAYLEARELSKAAAELEAAANDKGTPQLTLLAANFRNHLVTVLCGLVNFFAVRPSSTTSQHPLDHKTLQTLIARLAPKISDGDFTAAALLDELCTRLAGTPMAEMAKTISLLFHDLELGKARARLDELSRHIDLPPTHS